MKLRLLAFMAAAVAGGALHAQTVEVTPSNMGNWSFTQFSVNNDGSVSPCATGDSTCFNTGGAMVTGPTGTPVSGPPYGVGSANLFVDSNNFNSSTNAGYSGAALLGTTDYSGVALSAITALSYYTYDTANNGQQFPYLEIGISYQGITGDPSAGPGLDQLIFEPPYQTPGAGGPGIPDQGATQMNTWQSWNAAIGGLESNNAPGYGGGYGGVEPLSFWESYYIDPVITEDPTTGYDIAFGVGFADQDNYNGYVDGLTIGVNGTDTTYDFDPNATPEPSTFLLLGGGLLATFAARRRVKRVSAKQ